VATRELVERLHPLVIRIVRGHRPPPMAEEDLCQEVFMSLFASLDQYRGAVPLEHWVSRVAVNTCIDQLRRHRRRGELRWADLAEHEAEAMEAMLRDEQAPRAEHAVAVTDLVGKLLGALSPEDRLVIQWMELEKRPVKEVCALTGWSAALVKVRVFRARRKMRKHLERMLERDQR
jgi:RNA polymerase sigma-70 factor (ECF subfamily)